VEVNKVNKVEAGVLNNRYKEAVKLQPGVVHNNRAAPECRVKCRLLLVSIEIRPP
jgi:hypothetical protein